MSDRPAVFVLAALAFLASLAPAGGSQGTHVLSDGVQLEWERHFSGNKETSLEWYTASCAHGDVVYLAGLTQAPVTGWDGAVAAVDAGSGSELWRTEVFAGVNNPQPKACASDGARLVVVAQEAFDSGDLLVACLDAATGAPLWSEAVASTEVPFSVADVALTPDGSRAIVASTDRYAPADTEMAVRSYAAATGAFQWLWTSQALATDGFLEDVEPTPDGGGVAFSGWMSGAVGGTDMVSGVLDVATGTLRWARALNGPADKGDQGFAVAVSPDSSRIASAGRITNTSDASDDGDVAVVLYDAVTGVELARGTQDGLLHDGEYATDAEFSPDGAKVYLGAVHDSPFLVFAFVNNAVACVDAATGQFDWTTWLAVQVEHEQGLPRIAVSADGQRVHSVATGGATWLGTLDATTGGVLHTETIGEGSALGAADSIDLVLGGAAFVAGAPAVGPGGTADFVALVRDSQTGATGVDGWVDFGPDLDDSIGSLALSADGASLFGAGVGPGSGGGLYAAKLDVANGDVAWETAVSDPGFQYVAPLLRPSVDGSRLFASNTALLGFDDIWFTKILGSRTSALDAADGSLVWDQYTHGRRTHRLELAADGSRVYALLDDGLDAYASGSGNLAFEVAPAALGLDAITGLAPGGPGLPLVAHGYEAQSLSPIFPTLFAIDQIAAGLDASGAEVWSDTYEQPAPLPPTSSSTGVGAAHTWTAADGASAYAASTRYESDGRSRVIVVHHDLATGARLWKAERALEDVDGTLGLTATPCGGYLVFVVRNQTGTPPDLSPAGSSVVVLDAADGSEVVEVPIDPSIAESFQYGYPLDGAWSDDARFFVWTSIGSGDVAVARAVSTATGQETWSALLDPGPGGSARANAVAVAPGGAAVYVGGELDPLCATCAEDAGFVAAYTVPPSRLRGDVDAISVAAGGTQTLTLDAGACHAGGLYLVLGSFSGTAPALSIGGGIAIPLVVDPYFTYTLQSPNAPPLAASLGFLGALGAAAATVTLPPASQPALVGIHADHAYVVLDAATGLVELVSEPVGVDFVP